MTSSPQQQAGKLIDVFMAERFGITMWNRDLSRHAKDLAEDLAEAGLLVTPQVSSAERFEGEVVHEVARAIRDAYEQLPNGDAPDFTNVSDWYGEARAAISAYRQVVGDG